MSIFRRKAKGPTFTAEEFSEALRNGINGMMRPYIECVHQAIAEVAPEKHSEIAERLDWLLSQRAAKHKAAEYRKDMDR